MSHKASAWAMDQSPSTPLEKLVLLILADCHNEASGHCYPSITYISAKAMCSRRGAIKVIESLEAQGFISSKKMPGRVTYYAINRDRTGEQSAPVIALQPAVKEVTNRCTQFTGEQSSPVNTVHTTGEQSAPPLVNWTTQTGEHSAPEPGINRELNQEGNRGEERASPPPDDLVDPVCIVRTGSGYLITDQWEPSEAVRAMCIRAGVPRDIFDNPITVDLFRLKYAQAPCRDPAFDKRFVDWCVREHRNPRPMGDPQNRVSPKTVQTMSNLKEFIHG